MGQGLSQNIPYTLYNATIPSSHYGSSSCSLPSSGPFLAPFIQLTFPKWLTAPNSYIRNPVEDEHTVVAQTQMKIYREM